MSLRQLKWLTFILPPFAIALVEYIRHVRLQMHGWEGDLVPVVVVGLGTLLLTHFVFQRIYKLEAAILLRNEALAGVNAIADAVGRSLDTETEVKVALEKTVATTQAAMGALYLVGEDGNLTLKSHHNLGEVFVRDKINGLFEECLPGAPAFNCRQVMERMAPLIATERDRVVSSLPIVFEGDVRGTICLAGDRRLTAYDREMLLAIGHHIGSALENARLHEQVENMAVLEERDRIAREVHDGLAQVLGYLAMKSRVVQQLLPANLPAATEELREMERLADEAFADSREVILGLRTSLSILDRGLVRTLTEYINKFNHRSPVKAELIISDSDKFRFSPDTEIQLIRIVQEALTNVRKHARASQAWVRLEGKNGLASVSVADNGRGFDLPQGAQKGFGLQTMKERAESVGGSLEVDTVPGQGTTVTVLLPTIVKEKTY
ncbi:MAG: GAF domain-containing sensor histidine kinase [Chloroflexi bacterium]|nr:GAF domain-containing sensor histidine kinase [Chloroflexota bacterium]